MSKVGRPRTKPDTVAVQAARDYQKAYQSTRRARQIAAKVKAAQPVEAAVIPLNVQNCPPEKMERLFRRMM